MAAGFVARTETSLLGAGANQLLHVTPRRDAAETPPKKTDRKFVCGSASVLNRLAAASAGYSVRLLLQDDRQAAHRDGKPPSATGASAEGATSGYASKLITKYNKSTQSFIPQII